MIELGQAAVAVERPFTLPKLRVPRQKGQTRGVEVFVVLPSEPYQALKSGSYFNPGSLDSTHRPHEKRKGQRSWSIPGKVVVPRSS